MSIELSVPDAAGRESLAAILGHAFGVDSEKTRQWFALAGHDNLRVGLHGGDVASGLIIIPMGQYFGGRSVSMAGIAGVGVRRDRLRKGIATEMMKATLRELAASGCAISTLYGSNQALYRKVGYEHALTVFNATVATTALRSARVAGFERVLLDTADDGSTRALYNRVAPRSDGFVDRGSYVWPRMTGERRGQKAIGVGVYRLHEGPEQLAGYAWYRQCHGAEWMQLQVTDMAADSIEAAAAVWSFLADNATMSDSIRFRTAPADVFLRLLGDARPEVRMWENGMVRICAVDRALAERGYPAGLQTELHLDVVDDVVRANNGRWLASIEGGRAKVARGGRGDIRIDIRVLASLYTGFASARLANQIGMIDGTSRSFDNLDMAFSGPMPWMREEF